MFTNPLRASSSGKVLLADVHRAQQTGNKCSTRVYCSRVRPLELIIDLTPQRQSTNIPVSERRILLNRLVDNIWDQISEYAMPELDKEFHVETSTDNNDTSYEGDFELSDAKEVGDTVNTP